MNMCLCLCLCVSVGVCMHVQVCVCPNAINASGMIWILYDWFYSFGMAAVVSIGSGHGPSIKCVIE